MTDNIDTRMKGFDYRPEIRISVGTYTTDFSDLAISVHIDNERNYMAVIDPVTFKYFLEKITAIVGKDNPDFYHIPIFQMDNGVLDDYKNYAKFFSHVFEVGRHD